MTPRENVLEVLNWGKPEYVPMTFESIAMVGRQITGMYDHPLTESGYDIFGVHWLINAAGAMHDTSKLMFTDISEWRDYVKFPDMKDVDFTEIAKEEMSKIDRNQKLIVHYGVTGVYERLAAFMGFENLLCALLEDPDECRAFFDAMADWKIEIFHKINEAYHLDMYVYFDDVATYRGLFMSPQTYREVIKPAQAKIAKAVTDAGVRFCMHCCGKCEDILEDFVEIGATSWHSAQSLNDLQEVQKRFKGRLVIEGGWDSEGPCSREEAGEEEARAEVRRNMEEYGKNGGFIFLPVLLSAAGNSVITGGDRRMPFILDEYEKTKYCIK